MYRCNCIAIPTTTALHIDAIEGELYDTLSHPPALPVPPWSVPWSCLPALLPLMAAAPPPAPNTFLIRPDQAAGSRICQEACLGAT